MDEQQQKAPVHAKLTLRVSDDKKAAYVTVSPPQNGGDPIKAPALLAALREAGVVYGIRQETIARLTGAEPVYGKQEQIAVAAAPSRGTDASVAYHFTAERDLKPRELPDGSVDYKDLGLVSNAKAGDALCTKTPATVGQSGRNVCGDELPGLPGKDAQLPIGPGTHLSEDGLALLAALDGQVAIVNKRVTVTNLLVIEEDVGPGTGNIDFVGSVRVKGSVMSGFRVKASGSVTVQGILDGSVEAGGNVSIDNGFNGMASGEIAAGGDVRCKYLQNGKVSAKGNIYTGQIVGCIVRSGNTLTVSGSKSQIYNSELSARNTIACVNVGAAVQAKPVILEVGSDPELAQRKVSNPKEIAEVEKRLQSLEMLAAIFDERVKRGQLPPDRMKEYESVQTTRDALLNTLAELRMEHEEIEQSMAEAGFGAVVIEGTITEGTHVVIGAERYVLQSANRFVRYTRVVNEGIVSAPAK